METVTTRCQVLRLYRKWRGAAKGRRGKGRQGRGKEGSEKEGERRKMWKGKARREGSRGDPRVYI